MSDRRSTDRPGGRPVDPHNISSARTPPTAVCPGSRSNLDLLTATRFCRALPGRFENAQGRSAKAYVHKSVHTVSHRREPQVSARSSPARRQIRRREDAVYTPLDPHEPLSEVGQDRRNNCQPSAVVAQG